MKLTLFDESNAREIVDLFRRVFTESDGDEEGRAVGELVSNLITKTAPEDLVGCIALENSRLIGSVFFSRLSIPNEQVAFILSPLAVSSESQGKGVGQKLINYGLDHLKLLDVSLVFTYGDPNYYSKTGFRQISESVVKAPYHLSQPIGWLAQSLGGEPIRPMRGETRCVEALSDPAYW